MSKHTPGPWRVEEIDGMKGMFHIPIDAGEMGKTTFQNVAEVQPWYNDDTDEFEFTPASHANARLIAAAPELLLAAQLILEILNDRNGRAMGPGFKALESAIAKATGGDK